MCVCEYSHYIHIAGGGKGANTCFKLNSGIVFSCAGVSVNTGPSAPSRALTGVPPFWRAPLRAFSGALPCPSLPLFYCEDQGKCQKYQGLSALPKPLKSQEKKGTTLKSQGNSREGSKQRKSKNQGNEGQGLGDKSRRYSLVSCRLSGQTIRTPTFRRFARSIRRKIPILKHLARFARVASSLRFAFRFA